MSRLKRLISEVHHRSLWQVLAIYIGGAWVCYEIIDTVTDRLALASWLPVLAIFLFLLGLPFVLATAFVREEAPAEPAPGESAGAEGSPEVTSEAFAAHEETIARRRLLTWRNLGLSFVAVLAVWGAVAAGWVALRGSGAGKEGEPGSVAISAMRIAVLPFSMRGSDEVAYLGEGMVDLLSTALDGAGDLRVVDPYALMKFLAGERDAPLDPEAGEAVANQFGAGRFVLGSIVEAGGRLQVNASLYAADGRLEMSVEEIAEDESQVFDLVNNVARQLLAAGMGGPNARLTQVAAATTHSLPALKAYLEGEREYRAARFGAATTAYQRAIEADSMFALAYYRLAIAAMISPVPTGVVESRVAAQAVRLGGRLSQRDRDRLAVLEAFLNADTDEGERHVRAILSSYPEDVEAWYFLGELFFHRGARRGRRIDEAGEAFERALRYDPDHFVTLMHLSWVRSIQYRIADFEELLERMAELERESEYPQFSRPVLTFLRGGHAGVREILPELWAESELSLRLGGLRLAWLDEWLPSAVEIAGILTDPSRSASQRSVGYAAQANIELAQGHLGAAAAVLNHWESLGLQRGFEMPLEQRTAMWVSSFIPVERAELERLRDELTHLDYDTVYSPATRPYLLGLVSARLGTADETLRYAKELERHSARQGDDETSRAGRLAEYFATVLRARVTYDEGDYEEALRLLDGLRPDEWWDSWPNFLLLSQTQERWVRAQTLEALGRDEEALDWYASFGWDSYVETFYVSPALLRTAEIYERLGEPEKAAFYYRRFVTRWRDCDAELRPVVEAARRAIEALSPDG